MLKKSRVEERLMPGFLSWYMEFERVTETDIVTVAVKGNRGGIKSRFYVTYPELKEAVAKLEKGG